MSIFLNFTNPNNMKRLVALSCFILLISFLAHAQQAGNTQFFGQPWKMHHIDREFYNHNSLSPGDANGDGYDDYVVIHEGPDKITLLFHPGNREALYTKWPKVVVSEGQNVEYAYSGDFDGDNNLDIAYANGSHSSIHIIWGPDKKQVMDATAWEDAGALPASVNQGHYLFVESFDINRDGALDIVAGGRKLEDGGYTGLVWYEAPVAKKDRRALSQWKMHPIDLALKSGHGFMFVDIDNDNDEDIAVANADWDTPDHEEMVLWYENPGTESQEIYQPWKKHEVMESIMFFAKPQLGVGDMNNDGKVDLVGQSDNYIFYMEQVSPTEWKNHTIVKPEITRWVTRPTKVVDLNNDGKLDIVGMTIHNYGYTPIGKASVFWMEYEGEQPEEDNWQTHVIKWSDGFFTGERFQGEKWDHIRFVDIDQDGDLDILANCEEYYDKNRNTILGVVWFENPTID